ncbi:MAG: acyl dehydratase [Afipia broomeae]|jgi:hypothetical protein|uniref:MaoC-like domain-containing protein n=1 Tax=Afipia clevelandensis ATCC 49720 TaxID=883079 RepID=K8P8J6_9BRAD|nr:hypothetical protein [Afipia clevelandensis]EKS35965.1 hypothetical protein HMPREF9696_02177 [Afipia clevelandensis ATCC 49720]RTL78703.1 MAG: hypothetical protein EKK35_11625 [Bradyrhizobiaceae bacterium]
MTERLEPYRVKAYNTAKLSENKMHDDSVALKYGFKGGLVPGVDVLAYMIHVPVAKWGRAFLERGLIEARFAKPVYDGEMVLVQAEESGEVMALTVGSGEIAATGTALLAAKAPSFSLADYPDTAPVETRTPIDAESYRLGKWLGTAPRSWQGEVGAEYRAEVRDAEPIYAREGLVHPGVLQRIMNRVLMENALLGPWIHVGSRMQMLSAVADSDNLAARACVTANYEKKGHLLVELDALIVANQRIPVAHCQHTAIYQPRAEAL